MAIPFVNLQPTKRSQILAIDLGARFTKAVQVQRRGTGYELQRFARLDGWAGTRGSSAGSGSLTDHFKKVLETLGAQTGQTVLSLGVSDCVLRRAELPMMPLSDMRQVLRIGSKNYLQQDLSDHVFDCQLLGAVAGAGDAGRANQKCHVLAGGARRALVAEIQAAARAAGLTPELVVPGQVGPVNAFEAAQPEVFAKETVALIDFGFRGTTITILQQGELALTRTIDFGGDKLTQGLAAELAVPPAEAEELKRTEADIAQASLRDLLQPFTHELSQSFLLFEKEHEQRPAHLFVCGGGGCSSLIVQALQPDPTLLTHRLDPTAGLTLALPPAQMVELEAAAPQLATAIGAALAAF